MVRVSYFFGRLNAFFLPKKTSEILYGFFAAFFRQKCWSASRYAYQLDHFRSCERILKNYYEKELSSWGGLLEASLTAEKRSGDKCSRTDLWENEGYFKKLKCDDISIPKIKMPQNTIILTIPRYCIKMTRIFTTLEIIF